MFDQQNNKIERKVIEKDIITKLSKMMNPKHFIMLYDRSVKGLSGKEMADIYKTSKNCVESTLCQAKGRARMLINRLGINKHDIMGLH